MSTATESIDVVLDMDIIDHAHSLAPSLEGIARTAQEGTKRTADDRNLAVAIVEAALKLSIQVRGYARELAGLKARRIEGWVIGYEDGSGKLWFLHHALHWGNLFRCDRPEAAALFPDIKAISEWAQAASRPQGEDKDGKPWAIPFVQLDEHDLHAYPVRVVVDRDKARLLRAKIKSL